MCKMNRSRTRCDRDHFQTQNKIEPKVIRFIGQGITKNIQGVEEYEETS